MRNGFVLYNNDKSGSLSPHNEPRSFDLKNNFKFKYVVPIKIRVPSREEYINLDLIGQ
jgi:hypothetical protein